MPLERRVILRDAAGSSAGFEELRKNLITLSVTDAICKCASRNQPVLSGRGGRCLPGLFLNLDLPFQKRALFDGNALRGHVARHDCRLP